MKRELKISGMHCAACAARLEKALGAIEDIKVKKVDFKKGKCVIETKGEVDDEIIRESIKKLGFIME